MTLDEFVAEERETLDRFAAYWREGERRHPDQYRTDMSSGDWREEVARLVVALLADRLDRLLEH